MKVVALKIYKNQDKLLRILVESGLYSSLSECLRTAIWDFLKIEWQQDGSSLIIEKEYPEEHVKDFKSATVSITGKFPLSMIASVDTIVNTSKKYKNRSEFFRAALVYFLVADSKLFFPFILENKQVPVL